MSWNLNEELQYILLVACEIATVFNEIFLQYAAIYFITIAVKNS